MGSGAGCATYAVPDGDCQSVGGRAVGNGVVLGATGRRGEHEQAADGELPVAEVVQHVRGRVGGDRHRGPEIRALPKVVFATTGSRPRSPLRCSTSVRAEGRPGPRR